MKMEKFQATGAIGSSSRKYNHKDVEKAMKGIYEKINGRFVRIMGIKKQNSRVTIWGMIIIDGSLIIKEVKVSTIDGRFDSIEEVYYKDENYAEMTVKPSEIKRGNHTFEKVWID